MTIEVYASVFASFVIAVALASYVKHIAGSLRLIDHPNHRSSHSVATPRGGGIAIVIAASVIIAILTYLDVVEIDLALALLGGGIPIAFIGFMDDRGLASVRLRFLVHFAAAVWAIFILGGLPPLQIGHRLIDLGFVGHTLGVVAIVWALNLFNFMDGIDGIAASEAATVMGAGAAISIVGGGSLGVPIAAIVIGAASLGFLFWNWPPAKLFMGDVGSGYLGYVIAVLALASSRESPTKLWVWLLLGSVFFADATVTLILRLIRRERVYVAHRNHAYQRLAQRWRSHRRVTIGVILLNVLWLFPMGWLCALNPEYAVLLVSVALTPLILICLHIDHGVEKSPATVDSASS